SDCADAAQSLAVGQRERLVRASRGIHMNRSGIRSAKEDIRAVRHGTVAVQYDCLALSHGGGAGVGVGSVKNHLITAIRIPNEAADAADDVVEDHVCVSHLKMNDAIQRALA